MQQSEALAILNAGANVFLTGAPGAGKTYVLNEFVRAAREEGANVAVTASTGIAATHINGQTIHSWSGIGLATSLSERLLTTIRTRRKRKLQAADILVIDEVSMMHAWLFDVVDQVCRRIRLDPRPFGGLQVVACGDFFQLPPVSTSNRNHDVIAPTPEFVASRERYASLGRDPEGFITESLVWDELDCTVCYLTEQHRQDDGRLLGVLTDIRQGTVNDDDRAALATRLGMLPEPGQQAVNLFPVNKQADTLNDMRLFEIREEPHEYLARAAGPANLVERLKRNMLAPERLQLKTGAAVMVARHGSGVRAGIEGRLADRRIRKRQYRHHETRLLGDDGRRHRARQREPSTAALRVGDHDSQVAGHDARPRGDGPAPHLRAGHGVRGALPRGIDARAVSDRSERTHVPGLAGCCEA